MLILIALICVISVLLPNYHAMAQHDWNSQERLRPQEKGKAQAEVKPSEEWKAQQEQKRLQEWKAWHERKKLEDWKVRQEQKRLEEWKIRQEQKRLEEWKAQQEQKRLQEWKQRNNWRGERYPYGGYFPGPREGQYGARKAVRSEEEAGELLRKYFSQQKVTIGEVKRRDGFFEAEIRDRNNTPVDRVIIDKRTGRIRSIY